MTHALIIDDQRSNISVLGLLLEQAGITYHWTLHPAFIDQALADSQPPDLIFLDFEFPGADGVEMLEVLRAHPALQNVRIIAYTVHTSEIDRARRAGFDGFLGKPLDALDFPNQIRRLVSGEQVWVV